ncbi:MAG: hypothetical protein N3D75_03525 [Candidatus Aenigmarchaeota archaeon]|nr:hypothetical protein [Candidatus Aenigmarchaeota archaeon]
MDVIKRAILTFPLLATLILNACGGVPQQRKEEIKEEVPIVQTLTPTKRETATPTPTLTQKPTYTTTPTPTLTSTPDPIQMSMELAKQYEIVEMDPLDLRFVVRRGNKNIILYYSSFEEKYKIGNHLTMRDMLYFDANAIKDGTLDESEIKDVIDLLKLSYFSTKFNMLVWGMSGIIKEFPFDENFYRELMKDGLKRIYRPENIITDKMLEEQPYKWNLNKEQLMLNLFLFYLDEKLNRINISYDLLPIYKSTYEYMRNLPTYNSDLEVLGLNPEEFNKGVEADIKNLEQGMENIQFSQCSITIPIENKPLEIRRFNYRVLLTLDIPYIEARDKIFYKEVAQEIGPMLPYVALPNTKELIYNEKFVEYMEKNISKYEKEASENLNKHLVLDDSVCKGSVREYIGFLQVKNNMLTPVSENYSVGSTKSICGQIAFNKMTLDFLKIHGISTLGDMIPTKYSIFTEDGTKIDIETIPFNQEANVYFK